MLSKDSLLEIYIHHFMPYSKIAFVIQSKNSVSPCTIVTWHLTDYHINNSNAFSKFILRKNRPSEKIFIQTLFSQRVQHWEVAFYSILQTST